MSRPSRSRRARTTTQSNDTATLTHTASGGDYASVTKNQLVMTVTDNDTPGMTITPRTLDVDEGGAATYTVKLNTAPTGDVTVAITSNNPDGGDGVPGLADLHASELGTRPRR